MNLIGDVPRAGRRGEPGVRIGLVCGRAPGIERRGEALSAEWAFETDGTEKDYADWVTTRLEPQFVRKSISSKAMLFSRQFEGDIQTIQIETRTKDDRVEVHVGYRAMPF